MKNYCPVATLKWLEISKIKSGPIFRRFSEMSLTDKRLTDQSVIINEKYLKLAGIENKYFPGHSLRSGFAIQLQSQLLMNEILMAMTGHKTTQMVRRYQGMQIYLKIMH